MKVGQFLLALALLCTAASSQQRSATLVTVRDVSGAAVEKAQITCWAERLFGQPASQDDFVETMSDGSGRAVLRLVPGRSYEAFAAITRAGKVEVSQVLPVVSGQAVDAQLLAAREPEQIEVHGLAAWAAFAVTVSPTKTGSRFFDVSMGGVLPAMPTARRLRVLDALGQPIWETVLPNAVIDLPPPQQLSMRVCDANDKPIAAAELWQRFPAHDPVHEWRCLPSSRSQWRHLGTTDEKGELSAAVSLQVTSGLVRTPFVVEARARGFARAHSGIRFDGSLFRNHESIKVPSDHVLPLVLEPEQVLQLHPATPARLSVFGKLDGNMLDKTEGAFVIDVNAAGQGTLPLPANRQAIRVACFDHEDGSRVLAVIQRTASGLEIEASGRQVQLSVVDDCGLPAFDAQVWALAYLERIGWTQAVPVPLDLRGSANLEMDGNAWCLRVRRGNQIAWHVCDSESATATVKLVLADIPCMSISMIDVNGKLCSPRYLVMSMAMSSKGGNVASIEGRLLASMQFDLRRELLDFGRLEPQNPIRIRTLPVDWLDEFVRFNIAGQSHEVELASGGSKEIIVGQ
ncbi:MAG: hypothetical protein ACJAQZ_000869 [Planctomycetota bacterium]|jgi:hypothetical protein